MPAIKSVDIALTMIKNDNSKILDLTVGTHKVTPGQQIPKAGRSRNIAKISHEHSHAAHLANKQLQMPKPRLN
jgi:hypothetical protein